MMEIVGLVSAHRDRLAEFFQTLSSATLALWNRYGDVRLRPFAVADEVLAIPDDKQANFIAIDPGSGKAVGFSYLILFPERPAKRHVANLGIVVTDAVQDRGVGRALMEHMIQWSRARGLRKIWLATYVGNDRAFHLYRKLGFELEGIFMEDEWDGAAWRSVYSMALFLDPDQRARVGADRKRFWDAP